MGVLDDAIREHIELKREHGASETDLKRQEQEALGPARREAPAPTEPDPASAEPDPASAEPDPAGEEFEVAATEVVPPDAELDPEPGPAPDDAEDEDVLEETPEFLQETPDHDRLWFEQKPPRDFDFDE